ncbi:MAG: MmcQ/YjbR family DNA-binding protein [Armatimonadetes bacterium]|nr:MmcQ/YjbR family DNA-binding protein [Armatimonadota bacterium]
MTDEIRARLLAPFAELPEAAIEEVGPHVRMTVRGKTVGWAMENHHGNQRLEIHFKATREMQASVVDQDPRVLFIPPTVGHRGWVGAWLDLPEVPWELIAECLLEAWEGAASARALSAYRAAQEANHGNP